MIRTRLAALALAALAFPAAAPAADIALLELVLNGHATGRVGQFEDREGRLFAPAAELRELGFELPAATRQEGGLIALDSLPGLRLRIDRQRQTLLVTADATLLRPSELTARRGGALAPLSPGGWGAVLNYDVVGTWYAGSQYGGSTLDARAFSPYGTLEAGALSRFSTAALQDRHRRLGTTYTYTEPDAMRRWRVGDVITGALSWTRAVRLGGAQLSSDFALRPDLVTAALPAFSGAAALPSTVDLMVGGIRAFSQSVQPGPFEVRNLPVLTGAGEAVVTVTDALGRQTVSVLPFYAATSLLRPGLASYSLEAGPVRRDFGLSTDRYESWAAVGTARYGLTGWATVEGHVEATEGLQLGGGGAALRLGRLGVVDGSLAFSSGRGPAGAAPPGAAQGHQFALSAQRISRRLSLSASATFASAGYRDVASTFGSPLPRRTVRASLSLPLDHFGAFSLAYVNQRGGTVWRAAPDPWGMGGTAYQGTSSRFSLLTASYNLRLADGVSFYATAYSDLDRRNSFGGMAGVTIALGRGVTASATGSRDGGQDSLRLQAQRTAWAPGDVGFRLMNTEGPHTRRSAEVDYLSRWGRLGVGIEESVGVVSGRASVRGAAVLAGGGFFLADRVQDSFAIVRTGGVANVGVRHENRPVGTTDAAGRLLVPYLRSFQNNQLTIDPQALPIDIQAQRSRLIVRPGDRAGVTVDFGLSASSSALLRLQDGAGRPVPVGSTLRLAGLDPLPVGHDGETFATGLQAQNAGELEMPDGSRCRLRFAFRALPGDVPTIGPVPCH